MLIKDIIKLFNGIDINTYINLLKDLEDEDSFEDININIPFSEDLIEDFKSFNVNINNINQIILFMSYFLIEEEIIQKFVISNSLPCMEEYKLDLPEHFNNFRIPLVMMVNLNKYFKKDKFILVVSHSIVKHDMIRWLKWIHSIGCYWDKSVIDYSVRFGSINCLKYLDKYYEFKLENNYIKYIINNNLNVKEFIGYTSIECFDFLYEKKEKYLKFNLDYCAHQSYKYRNFKLLNYLIKLKIYNNFYYPFYEKHLK